MASLRSVMASLMSAAEVRLPSAMVRTCSTVCAPAVIEAYPAAQALSVTVSAEDHKPLTVPVDGSYRRLVRRLVVELPEAVGKLEIVSEPAGASVRFDGVDVGMTPLTLPRVRTDERHRIALQLAGYELDEVIDPATLAFDSTRAAFARYRVTAKNGDWMLPDTVRVLPETVGVRSRLQGAVGQPSEGEARWTVGAPAGSRLVEGSSRTIPSPRAKTSVFAVPRSTARSRAKNRLRKSKTMRSPCFAPDP